MWGPHCVLYCSGWVQLLQHAMWDPSSPTRYQTHDPALQGRFSSTGPPGKSLDQIIHCDGGCPGHCKAFHSISGLQEPPTPYSASCDNRKCFQTFSNTHGDSTASGESCGFSRPPGSQWLSLFSVTPWHKELRLVIVHISQPSLLFIILCLAPPDVLF